MSIQTAREFLVHTKGDEALRSKIREIGPGQAADMAHELGFECSAEEIVQALGELRAEGSSKHIDLASEQLDNVAGGGRPEKTYYSCDPGTGGGKGGGGGAPLC